MDMAILLPNALFMRQREEPQNARAERKHTHMIIVLLCAAYVRDLPTHQLLLVTSTPVEIRLVVKKELFS